MDDSVKHLNASHPGQPDALTGSMVSQDQNTAGAMTQTTASPKSKISGNTSQGADIAALDGEPTSSGGTPAGAAVAARQLQGTGAASRSTSSSPVPRLMLPRHTELEPAGPSGGPAKMRLPRIRLGLLAAMAKSVEATTGKTPRRPHPQQGGMSPRRSHLAGGMTPRGGKTPLTSGDLPMLAKGQSMRVTNEDGRAGMYELYELTKADDSTKVGLALEGCVIKEVEPATMADVVGLEKNMRILRVDTFAVHDNTSGHEIQRAIEAAPRVFEMEVLSLDKIISFDSFHGSEETFTNSSLSDGYRDDEDLFTLSVAQGGLLLLVVVFLVGPLLVLLLALLTAGFLALILGWAFEETFYLACSILVTPLGGQPILTHHNSEGDYSMGGNLYLTVLAALGVGYFGILQLCTAPAIAPLFSFTKAILAKVKDNKKDQEVGEEDGTELVRKLSKWRLQGAASPDPASPDRNQRRLANRNNPKRGTTVKSPL